VVSGEARLRFHGDLAALAWHADEDGVAAVRAPPHRTLKDAVEACGIPHTEVDLLLADGATVGFDHRLVPGMTADVHPPSAVPADAPPSRVRPAPLPGPRFVADVHLQRLAELLRLVGLDARCDDDADDPALAEIAEAERRWLLTRDRGLLTRRRVTHGYLVRAHDPRAQLEEVVARFGLAEALAPLSRCAHCNGRLEPVDKDEIVHRLEPGTRAAYDEFARCTGCGQVFWRGAHADALDKLAAAARRSG
jgi:uncharacterized protein with PIN domain